MPSTPTNKRQEVEATVHTVRNHGVRLTYADGRLGWLPAEEWSYDPDDWKHDRLILKPKMRLRVLRWYVGFNDDIIFSRRRVEHNPWNTVDEDWIGKVLTLTVTRLTPRYAIGEILPGLVGRFDRSAFTAYFKGHAPADSLWPYHAEPWVGDRIVGLVAAIHAPDGVKEPEIELDPVAFLQQLARDPKALDAVVRDARSKGVLQWDILPWETSAGSVSRAPFTDDESPNILLVEDDKRLAEGIKGNLIGRGYDVTCLQSESDALAWLDARHAGELHIALVDVHLTENPTVFDGLAVARRLRAEEPDCRVVITSGDDDLAAAGEGLELHVSGYLPKPFTAAELQAALTNADGERPLRSLLAVASPPPAQPVAARARASTTADEKTRTQIHQLLADLARRIPETVVHVFEMNHLDHQVRSLAHAGQWLNYEDWRHKLAQSPVRDTAIDRDRKPWMDNDTMPHFATRHRWLLQALAYRSFVGVPVEVTSPLGYCLLAFHGEPRRFDQQFFLEAQLCAERVGRALARERLVAQSASRARFEAAGMTLGFLTHELRNQLTAAALDTENLLGSLDRSTGEVPHADALRTLGRSVRDAVAAAVDISRTFAGVQRRPAAAGDVEWVDPTECLKAALRAVRPFLPEQCSIEIRVRGTPLAAEWGCWAERAGLIIALFNLALNAAQQMGAFVRRRGMIDASYDVHDVLGEPWLRIDLTDTGPGIHRGDFKRIFETGYTTRKDGSGMGLHIASEVIGQVRDGDRCGRLHLSWSAIGVGATFTVHLPLARAR